jgi:plastocyanin
MVRRNWIVIVAATAVLVLTGAACSSGNDNGSSGSTGGGAQTTAPTGTETTSGGEGQGGSGAADVVAEDFDFSPTDGSASSGSTITVKNDSATTPHTFTVDGTDIDQSLDPDTESHVKIDLKAGSYDFHCTIHPQMTGTLTVT